MSLVFTGGRCGSVPTSHIQRYMAAGGTYFYGWRAGHGTAWRGEVRRAPAGHGRARQGKTGILEQWARCYQGRAFLLLCRGAAKQLAELLRWDAGAMSDQGGPGNRPNMLKADAEPSAE